MELFFDIIIGIILIDVGFLFGTWWRGRCTKVSGYIMIDYEDSDKQPTAYLQMEKSPNTMHNGEDITLRVRKNHS